VLIMATRGHDFREVVLIMGSTQDRVTMVDPAAL